MGDAVYVEVCDAGTSLTQAANAAALGHGTQHIGVRWATGILRERHNTSKRCFNVLWSWNEVGTCSNFRSTPSSPDRVAVGTELEHVPTLFHANTLQFTEISKAPMAGIPRQSRLVPFEREIGDLRARRPPTPYRQILCLLRKKHGVQTSLHALYSFVQVRKKWDRVHRSATDSSISKPPRVSPPLKPVLAVPAGAKAVLDRPAAAAPRSANVQLPRQNPSGRTLKSFTPSSEYNLERLTPEQMAEWLAELKREQGG